MDLVAPAVKEKLPAVLLPVFFLVLTLFLFTPAKIHLGNFMELSSSFPESMLLFLAVSLVLATVLAVPAALASRNPRAGRIASAVIVATGFLVWLQANILPWPYGVLDGKDIPWRSLARYGVLDTAIWVVVVVCAAAGAGAVSRISRILSAFFIVVQVLSVGWGWISMPKDQGFKRQVTATDTLHRYSEHVNVVVLVLDTFQSDIFQDIVRGDDGLRAVFDGFTYFRNALAGSDGTVVSVPNMLTAANYDNTVPYLEFVRSSFLDRSLPRTLTEYGFRVDLLPILNHSVYTDFSGTPPTGKRLRDWPAFIEEQALVADLAVFRCVPHFAKELVYNRQHWLVSGLVKRFFEVKAAGGASGGGEPGSAVSSGTKYARELANSKSLIGRSRDARFIDEMLAESGVLGGTDAFKFIHLNGIHPALVVNENLEYEVMDRTRANMVRQGTGILKIAALFLERLERLGVYDNSLIFIVGDHGSGLADTGINVSPLTATFNTRGPYTGNFKTFKAAGIPLILAKKMNARGALKTSDAPVALGDIPRTVVEALGLEAEFPGRSMFSVREDERRERIYRAFVGPQEDVVYLAPLYEYAVNGHSWDDASWRETGNVYSAPSGAEAAPTGTPASAPSTRGRP